MPIVLASLLLGLAAAASPDPPRAGPPLHPCQSSQARQIADCQFAPTADPAAILSMTQLPADVRWAFARDCGEFDIADVYANWNGTDVVRPGLPARRLASARQQGDEWIVEYARGGFVGERFLAVFRTQPDVRLVHGNCGDDRPPRRPVRLPAYLGDEGRERD